MPLIIFILILLYFTTCNDIKQTKIQIDYLEIN